MKTLIQQSDSRYQRFCFSNKILHILNTAYPCLSSKKMILLLNSAILDFFIHLVAQTVENLPSVRPGFDPSVGKIPWKRTWQPTPVCTCLENPHGQRSLTDHSPWGHKESDMTDHLNTEQHKHIT